MNSTEENYEIKLNKILNKFKNIEKDNIEKKDNIKKTDNEEKKKSEQCNTLNSLNYCLEMHKVRLNQKSDFDIHSTNKYNIEDEDIDKFDILVSWKDLSQKEKDNCINIYCNELKTTYNLNYDYIYNFICENINKIKYNKVKKYITLNGLICIKENNKNLLKIKPKISTKSTAINKLRKSLKSFKK